MPNYWAELTVPKTSGPRTLPSAPTTRKDTRKIRASKNSAAKKKRTNTSKAKLITSMMTMQLPSSRSEASNASSAVVVFVASCALGLSVRT